MQAKIYYSRPQAFRDVIMGLDFVRDNCPELYGKLKAHDIVESYQLLALYPMQDGETLESLFAFYQGEVWSPNGEAKELILALALNHTSMSVGDIIELAGKFFFCDNTGWVEL